MASGPMTSWQIDGEIIETVTDFILAEGGRGGREGSKITADDDCKRSLFLGRKLCTT